MKLKHTLIILFPTFLFSQNFPYQRQWGTYLGGANTRISQVHEDPQTQSVSVYGYTEYPIITTAPPLDYYNQFVSPGGHPFTYSTENNFSNMFSGKLSSTGNMLLSEYPFSGKKIYFKDEPENVYIISENISTSPLPSGVWLSNPVTDKDGILSKYDVNNNLLWRTYIPGKVSSTIATDSEGNIYITGTTSWQNLGDPETFQPDFTVVPDFFGSPLPNSYIVKLNPQGQKIWATYTPSKEILNIHAYQDNIYISGYNDLDQTNSALATPGAFQIEKSGQFLSKINGNTGKRIWGTYYGIPHTDSGSITGIKTTSSGIYLSGTTIIPSTYYATSGAYKQEATDPFDLFLVKFNDNGQQEWGTYLGSNGYDFANSYGSIDVKNDRILISGATFGASNNIASAGAFVSTRPNPTRRDIFFSMFGTSGSHIFTSYYGGPNNNLGDNIVNDSEIACKFSENSDSFYLFGTTENTSGFTTPNAPLQDIIYPPNSLGRAGFLIKFSSRVLSTSETGTSTDLVLYNNPNNGNFSLKGGILEKESYLITITDMPGRLVYSAPTSKKAEEHFNLAGRLETGTYLLTVSKPDKTPVKTFKLIIKK
ncbi:MAG: T9SS type A sorting domain-containing protein [Chryseobacterium sp.]|jgi:hypothetical protein|uniref:T9SS type A sorting domain-containing protein n=1 Tax=Chryseobacterium sp. TaxID=1871047 RepID=UPI0028308CA7|nr:T9SS type A sorting domain-containing protein [Chryseobacterium sp.]MDR2234799.1 T9SS type A sorting domain-containing protein [Chryseobacterium sp.]